MASLLCFAVCALCACGDDPAPTPMDARVGYPDIAPVPVDGMNVQDTPAADIVDERGSGCRGGFRPCECSPGELGRDYCIGTAYEGMCRCGDAGPPVTDAAADVVRDSASDAQTDAQSDTSSDAQGDAAAD